MLEKIYLHNKINSHRYALGSLSTRTLFVFGVNPSTATDKKLDSTVTNVQSFSKILGFDSFLMLNLSSQRSTNPDKMSYRVNKREQEKNMEVISGLIHTNATVWAAWGDLISKRDYLVENYLKICDILAGREIKWIAYDVLTKKGHPKHPARKKLENRFSHFDIARYTDNLINK